MARSGWRCCGRSSPTSGWGAELAELDAQVLDRTTLGLADGPGFGELVDRRDRARAGLAEARAARVAGCRATAEGLVDSALEGEEPARLELHRLAADHAVEFAAGLADVLSACRPDRLVLAVPAVAGGGPP